MKSTLRAFYSLLLLASGVQSTDAAVVSFAMNFAKNREAAGTTAAYTSPGLGGSAIPWTVNASGSRTTTAQTTPVATLGAPASISYYYDGSGTGRNTMASVGTTNANRGFLGDGVYATGATTGWAVEIVGLSDWLAANNASEWQVIVLRSTSVRNAQFRDINLWEADNVTLTGTSQNNWLGDPTAINGGLNRWPERLNAPDGVLSTNASTYATAVGGAYAETSVYSGTGDAFIIRDSGVRNTGTTAAPIRGSISGVIIQVTQNSIVAVPEPTTAALAGLSLMALIRRRRAVA
jgi:hypothetical protein